jgi:hypothetical protein
MLHTKQCQNKTLFFFTSENTKDNESLRSIVEVSYILLNTRTDLIDRLRISAMMLLKYCLECNIHCLPRHFEINVHLFYKKAPSVWWQTVAHLEAQWPIMCSVL